MYFRWGVKIDDEGNLIFDPENFLKGFIYGSGGTYGLKKALNSPNLRRIIEQRVANIRHDYLALSTQNPKFFAKILNNNAEILTMDKKQMQITTKEIFNKELQSQIQKAIKQGEIKNIPGNTFKNFDDFKAGFDSVKNGRGVIKTPYKEVKVNLPYAWRHFRQNTYNTNRDNIKGAFFETFKNPLFIVEQTRENKAKPSVYFYKPFFDSEKKLINLFGIGLNADGSVDFKTFYLDKNGTRLKNLLNDKDLKIKFVR